jgi:hypothetical protein
MKNNAQINEKQTKLLIEAITKNAWSNAADIRVAAWSNYHASQDVIKNYMCQDGSGYVRGFYDGAGTFFVKRFHLRDEEWADPLSSQA